MGLKSLFKKIAPLDKNGPEVKISIYGFSDQARVMKLSGNEQVAEDAFKAAGRTGAFHGWKRDLEREVSRLARVLGCGVGMMVPGIVLSACAGAAAVVFLAFLAENGGLRWLLLLVASVVACIAGVPLIVFGGIKMATTKSRRLEWLQDQLFEDKAGARPPC